MAVLIPAEYFKTKEPRHKWLLWGRYVCPRCHRDLSIKWDTPIHIKFPTLGGKALMSLVAYSCTCGYLFKEYEDNYLGDYIPQFYK